MKRFRGCEEEGNGKLQGVKCFQLTANIIAGLSSLVV